jgi:hypothetical protein
MRLVAVPGRGSDLLIVRNDTNESESSLKEPRQSSIYSCLHFAALYIYDNVIDQDGRLQSYFGTFSSFFETIYQPKPSYFINTSEPRTIRLDPQVSVSLAAEIDAVLTTIGYMHP